MDVAITTDYVRSDGCPEDALRRIAAAGWRWLHWCHQWNTDFLYAEPELRQIERWLGDLGLRVLDLHGSDGREKHWASPREYERLAGVELVRNRVEMAGRLGCQVVIMHPPGKAEQWADAAQGAALWDRFRRSLDALEPDCRRHGVRLAFENLFPDRFDVIERILGEYGPEFAGLCYDSGHGQITGNGLDRLAPLAGRLLAVHLHDNDGRQDLHQPLFMGKVDWPRLAKLLASSGYARPALSIEAVIKHSGTVDEDAFLQTTRAGAESFAATAFPKSYGVSD